MTIASCIGCACTDRHACHDENAGGPCSWLEVDYEVGRGVCSCCADQLERWNAGDRLIRNDDHEPQFSWVGIEK